MSDEESMLGVGSDAETVVGAASYEPDDVCLRIGEHELLLFFDGRELDVGEIVAHEFRAFHSEGMETVALLHRPDSDGEYDLVCIERSDVGIT